MSKISKNPLLEMPPYCDNDDEWEDFCAEIGRLVEKRFKTGYILCKAENLGWRHRSGYKVFKFSVDDVFKNSLGKTYYEAGFRFLQQFMPQCDWSATVYSLNGGKGLYFSVSHHDAQGESYYLTPISERTYERMS